MRTCRHYRFRIPTEDADALREADCEPCELCDSLPRKTRSVLVEWNPRNIRTDSLPGWEAVSQFLTGLHRLGQLDLGRVARDMIHEHRARLTPSSAQFPQPR